MNTWLDEHLETFVRPYLGCIPNLTDKPSKKSGHIDWSEILTNEAFYLLYCSWQEAKSRAAGRPILLPGRDVWLLEVIARCEGENYPTVFRPELSTVGARFYGLDHPWKNHYVVDSGYSGSCPKTMGLPFGLISGPFQLHPITHRQILAKAYSLCAAMEGCPKYWRRCEGDVPGWYPTSGVDSVYYLRPQVLDTKGMFREAAIITRRLAKFIQESRRCGSLFSKMKFTDFDDRSFTPSWGLAPPPSLHVVKKPKPAGKGSPPTTSCSLTTTCEGYSIPPSIPIPATSSSVGPSIGSILTAPKHSGWTALEASLQRLKSSSTHKTT